ncbi:hypothetical protein SAMN04489740_4097 [Arthrobacter alpinus]|uniref:Uncharacterized protein n=1 Tax=Arthrobacter alpinus TaxID=656366 RepID=A0A1H5PBZ5_9MICC|nr:hypothetical protein [Arthrobacter alpinus]SEF11379.1 hypothetical protein SAMN04489740_4097 [Arthrobacter alpinus]
MVQGVVAGGWDDWSNIKAMGLPGVVAVSVTLAVFIAAVMIGFTLLTLRRARRRGALPAKVSPLRNRRTGPQTRRPPKGDGEEPEQSLG